MIKQKQVFKKVLSDDYQTNMKLQFSYRHLAVAHHRNSGLLNVHICSMLNTIQTMLYKAVNTRKPPVVPVLRNVFLIIRAAEYYHVFYII